MTSNLHRIMGGKFQHAKPNLCPICKFNQPYGEWEGYCTVRRKILSVSPHKTGKCDDYEKQSDTGANGEATSHE